MTIGSCSVSSEPCSVLDVDKTSFTKWEEVESTLKSILSPEYLEHVEAKLSYAQALRSRGFSKEFVSKLWLVTEHLAKSLIERKTQIYRQSKHNPLFWNYTTNDSVLCY